MEIEIVKCDTPKVMQLDVCKNCKRATSATKREETETFQPKKRMFGGWECDEYINKDQGSLF